MTIGVRLLLVTVSATTVTAADDAEFAFNLLSDVAPILALFGDAFARQFMSESLTWVDHLIFAMVPLGIITTITAAIRVQGMQVAKAFVGRARENRALAEIELMSSTSGEVCELFNGNAIVRSMGAAEIDQFLIFPNVYDALEQEYKQSDEADKEEPEDKSCGIHSLDTATSGEPRGSRPMVCKPYCGKGATMIQECVRSGLEFLRNLRNDPLDMFKKLFRSASSSSESGDEERIVAPLTKGEEEYFIRTADKERAFSGPPNLQLNLSSDHFDQSTLKKRHELFLAAVAAVLLQTGLIVVAAATAYRLSPGSSSLLESKPYGFPCYAAGSVLLSIGTGLCSFIVEHSTTEISWEVINHTAEKTNAAKENAPRLVWIQRCQTVNDQSFKGYVILAGPKRRVITSRRGDGLASKKIKGFWEWLTVGAALLAGLGFTAQFMGLRGLAFPCSIAHLGAILIMALIRAGIRRRLGKIPAHCPAFEGHELDFLAIQLVFYPEVRTSDQRGRGKENYGGDKLPSDLCRWRVRTADPEQQDALFAQPTPVSQEITSESEQHRSSATSQESTTGPKFKASSSQQLIRVRARLGDLCHFTFKSTENALSLARSIELFMNSFLLLPTRDDERGKFLCHVDWRIEATKFTRNGVSKYPDIVRIPVVRRHSDGKWEVDVAKMDAILSLWIAGIEARRAGDAQDAQQRRDAQQRKYALGRGRDLAHHPGAPSPDWRRIKVGDDSRRNFGRIIGDNLNDEVLKRDISWWIDRNVAEQSDPAVEDDNDSSDDDGSTEGNGRLWSRARTSDVDLVIGFNGDRPHGGPVRELGIISNDYLPTILAQHLFTSFMWTATDLLPQNCLNPGIDEIQREVEIEGPKEFNAYDSSFAEEWLRIKLRHRQLTKVVRKMESYGLGSTTDILLCMIPALSSRNLLPNQAILKLMPRVSSIRGWVEIATCHNKLLRMIKADKVSKEDRLSVGIVVASMDFLSFAHEPYDEQLDPPQDLDEELGAIARELLSPKFTTILEKLAPVYRRQGRHRLLDKVLNYPTDIGFDLDEDFAKNVLGFTQYHLLMFQILDVESFSIERRIMRAAKGAKTHDIFGWTPYHYACAADNNSFRFEYLFHEAVERIPSMLDNLGRSPIHFTVLADRAYTLSEIFDELSKEGCKRAIQASGIDDMTLLHSIAKSGSLACLETISRAEAMSTAEAKALLAKKDIWGRQALHIASKLGHEEIAAKFLEMGSRSDELDNAGKCPVDYFVQRLKGEGLKIVDQRTYSSDSEANESSSNDSEANAPSSNQLEMESKPLGEESFNLFLKFAMEPHCRYNNGKTFLHIAVEVASDENICTLVREKGFDVEAQDNDRRTPLHHAILSGRPSVAITLIKDLQAKPSAKDSGNTTALMFAVQKDFIEVARELLNALDSASGNEVDNYKKAAIHYVRSREMIDLLIEKECDLLALDSEGRTALHTAIERKDTDVALYLLGLEDPCQVQTEPFDGEAESLLIAACKRGLPEVVPEILKRWPGIINTGDARYGQPPVSWACENGHSGVVEKLLQHEGSERVDVNRIATGWRKYTPLHFAAKAEDSKSLALLLEQPSTELHQESDKGETPLRLAVKNQRKDAARRLLQDHRTTPQERLRYIQQFTSSSSRAFHSIIGDILETFADTSLILEYFLWLFDHTARPDAQESIDNFVGDLKRGGWKKLKTPYHLAILLGDTKFVQILKEQNVPEGGLDEENWSLVDYAKRFDRDGILTSLVNHFQPLGASMEHKHKEPTTLICTSFESTVKVISCAIEGHERCSKVHDIEVIRASSDARCACMRSDHSIPPSKKQFYFEAEVLRDSASQIFGIGFCGFSGGEKKMPGWFKGSWGYHGDDGKFFIEFGHGVTPSSDFGDSGKFKSGDVVGICLNVNTGQGFCTRNGKKLDMGNAFEGHEESFKYGKMYPCVAFDVREGGVGLQFRVNFDGSDAHPFMYKGPFEV